MGLIVGVAGYGAPVARDSAPAPTSDPAAKASDPAPAGQPAPYPRPAAGAAPAPPPVPVPPPPVIAPESVVAAVQGVEPHATVGALVVDRFSHAELLTVNPDRQFRSASLVKLLIAIDALTRGGNDKLTKTVTMMLRLSDDNLASSLWVAGGGSVLVTETSQLIGLTGTSPPPASRPGRWGDVLLTARDVVRIYDYVLTGLPAPHRDLIVAALAGAPRRAADGFDQYFGLPDGLGAGWAIKQGWSNSTNDIVLHSTGLDAGQRHVAVLLTEHPLGVRWRTAAASVTAGAQALAPLF